jgi:SNF2 family DNA or RNA helicase
MIRREKSVILPELPPINKICIPLCLTNARKYRKLEETLTDDDGNVLCEDAAKKLYAELFEYKAEAVIEWIDTWLEQNPDEKIVIAAYHLNALNLLYEHYGKIALLIDGGVTGNKRQSIVDMFQEDNKHRIIFLQVLTAVGYTLTRASTIAIVELYYVPGDLDQTLARVHRLTSGALQVNAYFLIGSKTIEERIMEMLDEKQVGVSTVLDGKAEKFFKDSNEETLETVGKSTRGKGRRE